MAEIGVARQSARSALRTRSHGYTKRSQALDGLELRPILDGATDSRNARLADAPPGSEWPGPA